MARFFFHCCSDKKKLPLWLYLVFFKSHVFLKIHFFVTELWNFELLAKRTTYSRKTWMIKRILAAYKIWPSSQELAVLYWYFESTLRRIQNLIYCYSDSTMKLFVFALFAIGIGGSWATVVPGNETIYFKFWFFHYQYIFSF